MTHNVFQQRDEFGLWLRNLRHGAGLTLRDVELLTGITYSMISAIERGEKAVGSEVAVKLAEALQVPEAQRNKFLLAAAGTRRRDKLTAYSRNLAPEIVNYVAQSLQCMGVELDQITTAELKKTPSQNNPNAPDELIIHFIDGTKMLCDLVVNPRA